MTYLISSRDSVHLNEFSRLNWVYIGEYKGFEEVNPVLAEEKRKYIAKEIQALAESLKQNFIDFIGQLSTFQPDLILWYSSCLASKSLTQAKTYKLYIYLKLIEQLSRSENEYLVVTDDDELLSYSNRCLGDKIRIFEGPKRNKFSFHEIFHPYRRILKYIFSWILVQPYKNKSLAGYQVLFHSWIDDRVFLRLPQFHHSYFNELPGHLKQQGKRIGYLTYADIGFKHLLKLIKNFDNMVFLWSYLPFFQLIGKITRPFKVEIDVEKLKGIKDVKMLVSLARYEEGKENHTKDYLGHYLSFFAYQNLSKSLGKEAAVFYPFENQHWEKMLCVALKDFNIIGYQHASLPINELNYQKSSFEKNPPLPKMIIYSGKKWLEVLGKYYDNRILRDAGALRYSYLFGPQCGDFKNCQSHTIVIALSVNPSAAVSLQKKFLGLLKDGRLKDQKVKIKPHPQLEKSLILDEELSRYKNCQIVTDNIEDLLKDCRLFVGSDSTVLYEAAILGIKTATFFPEDLVYGCDYLLWDRIDCIYEKDFERDFLKALEDRDHPAMKIQPEEYFSKPNWAVFESCLKS